MPDYMEEKYDYLMDRLLPLIPDHDATSPFPATAKNIDHFARDKFADQQSYEYMRWFLCSIYFFLGREFASRTLNIEDWASLEIPGKIGTDDIDTACLHVMAALIHDPGGEIVEASAAVDRLFNAANVPDLIPRSEWAGLPEVLQIHHVAALIQTTPRNVRNIVNRKPDYLPPRIIKPGHRINYHWRWQKGPILRFVEENYSQLYD